MIITKIGIGELKTMIFVNASLFKDLEVEKMELEKKPS